MNLLGIDFTCVPTRRKPVTVARGRRAGEVVRLVRLDELHSLSAFEDVLAEPGPWTGGFDFPFGLPRAFVEAHALGRDAAQVLRAVHARCPARMDFRAFVDAWGNGRPAGQRLVHRACDTALSHGVTSSSPLQTRYVPVGFMWFEGFARLLAAGVAVPGLVAGDAARRAFEAYPGLLAAEVLGRRSYKNSDEADRLIARKDLVDALEQGRTRLGLRLKMTHAMRDALVADASGDRLDAALALLQAAWADLHPERAVPADADPVEGFIVAA